MKKMLAFVCPFLALISTGVSFAGFHGPIIQWSSSPETTAHVRWIESASSNQGWLKGRGGFGYGDSDDKTVLRDMEGKYTQLYLRRALNLSNDLPAGSRVWLRARYDDAFTMAINGKEVARENVRIVDGKEQVIQKHEAQTWEDIELGAFPAGNHIISAIGFNDGLQSSDFTIDFEVIAKWDGGEKKLISTGDEWEYLAGQKPGAGWRQALGVTPELEKKPESPSLEYRIGKSGEWKKTEVTRGPLADSQHIVGGATLTGMSPGDEVEVRIADRLVRFHTASTIPEELDFVTGGDMYHRRPLLDAMNARAGKQNPSFALLGGDLAYTNNVKPDRWLDWFDSWYDNAVTPDGYQVPMVVVIGNHEIDKAAYRPNDAPGPEAADEFFSLFKMQETDLARQVIDFEAGLSLVLLDSGHSANLESQIEWLKEKLENRRKVKRLFVCYHRPAWGCGTKEDAVEIQKAWCPWFERYLVDAVFENDHHVQSRTVPIKAGKPDVKEGVPYLGAGSWGVGIRQVPKDWKEVRPWLANAAARNHLYHIKMSDKEWTAECMDAEGDVFDRYSQPWRRQTN